MKRVALAVVAVSLSACGAARPNDNRICTSTPPLEDLIERKAAAGTPAAIAEAEQANLNGCLHRWAYRLAGSTDPAPVVADAVLGACWDAMIYQNGTELDYQIDQMKRGRPGFDISLVRTGQTVSLEAKNYEENRAKALFHVVQARAGNCKVPE